MRSIRFARQTSARTISFIFCCATAIISTLCKFGSFEVVYNLRNWNVAIDNPTVFVHSARCAVCSFKRHPHNRFRLWSNVKIWLYHQSQHFFTRFTFFRVQNYCFTSVWLLLFSFTSSFSCSTLLVNAFFCVLMPYMCMYFFWGFHFRRKMAISFFCAHSLYAHFVYVQFRLRCPNILRWCRTNCEIFARKTNDGFSLKDYILIERCIHKWSENCCTNIIYSIQLHTHVPLLHGQSRNVQTNKVTKSPKCNCHSDRAV